MAETAIFRNGMRLGEHLAAIGQTKAGFARRPEIATDPRTVGRWVLAGERPEHPDARIPAPAAMRAIYVATGGRVTPNDFYDLPPLEAEAAA